MDRKQIKKNVLDLRYNFESQKINAIILIGSIGILAFLGTFIWYGERLFLGLGISIFVIAISIVSYIIIKKRMDKILDDVRNL